LTQAGYGKIGLADPAIELFRNTASADGFRAPLTGAPRWRTSTGCSNTRKYSRAGTSSAEADGGSHSGQPSDGGGSRFSIDEIDDAVRTRLT
jgi:hypothetical protein